jgi:hypothetical protein
MSIRQWVVRKFLCIGHLAPVSGWRLRVYTWLYPEIRKYMKKRSEYANT